MLVNEKSLKYDTDQLRKSKRMRNKILPTLFFLFCLEFSLLKKRGKNSVGDGFRVEIGAFCHLFKQPLYLLMAFYLPCQWNTQVTDSIHDQFHHSMCGWLSTRKFIELHYNFARIFYMDLLYHYSFSQNN